MKIGKVTARNFCSYKTLEFDFNDLGLTGVFGTTGAGKSTLMDLVPWALWGITSKGGAADDVRAWETENDELTEVYLSVQLHSGEILVSRIRGSAGKNDLYWREHKGSNGELSDAIRGKDLKDTQKLLDQRLGVTADLYLTAGYMSQFSEADAFFIASAKARREVLEKIADQEFAVKLGERASAERKAAKFLLEGLEKELAKNSGSLATLQNSHARTRKSLNDWELNRLDRVALLQRKIESYSADVATKSTAWEKERLERLDRLATAIQAAGEPADSDVFDYRIAHLTQQSRCITCNALSDKHAEELTQLKQDRLKNTFLSEKIQKLYAEQQKETELSNPHVLQESPYQHQFEEALNDDNPFTGSLAVYTQEIESAEARIEASKYLITSAQVRLTHLNWLYDKSFELRGLMMGRVVREIEGKTNDYLEKFFDGALRVQLRCEDADKIEVHITNNGHMCPFLSLSGGERTMLKLSFSLSLMQAAQNKAGLALNCVMLDEPLNGLPEDLKVKAFSLFEQLTDGYSTVLVIDHSSLFQQQFHRKFMVDKVGGTSRITEE